MAHQAFFLQRPQIHPTIYAYSLPGVASHSGYLKVGFTERDVETRVREQVHTVGVPFKIHLRESAMSMPFSEEEASVSSMPDRTGTNGSNAL